MAVKIIKAAKKSAVSSNKPPTEPNSPDPKTYEKYLVCNDGTMIWLSSPVPDRIVVIGFILANHFPDLEKKGKDALPDYVAELVNGLSGMQIMGGDGPGYVAIGPKKIWGKFSLPLGPRLARAHIVIERLKPKNQTEHVFRLRLEFNPRKLAKDGVIQLCEVLSQSAHVPFPVGRFLADAKITRLDIAVDLVGVTPSELMVSTSNEGKRVEYATEGQLETVQVHGKKKVPKKPLKKKSRSPLGPFRVKVYDRNRERAAVGKPVPVPGHQVTRVEIVKSRYIGMLGVADLPGYSDPFKGLRVTYATDQSPWLPCDSWNVYLAARRALGHKEATKVLGYEPKRAALAAKAYSGHPGDLIPGTVWKAWACGLAQTGLQHLVNLAIAEKSKSKKKA